MDPRGSYRRSTNMPAMPFVLTVLAAMASPTEARIAERVRAFHGTMGVYAKNLDTGEVIAVDADRRFPTASLIKVAVMAEVYRQIEAGKIRLEQKLVLRDAEKAGDETIPLNMLHDGTELTVSDLLKFMIAYS